MLSLEGRLRQNLNNSSIPVWENEVLLESYAVHQRIKPCALFSGRYKEIIEQIYGNYLCVVDWGRFILVYRDRNLRGIHEFLNIVRDKDISLIEYESYQIDLGHLLGYLQPMIMNCSITHTYLMSLEAFETSLNGTYKNRWVVMTQRFDPAKISFQRVVEEFEIYNKIYSDMGLVLRLGIEK